jgi:hypothetical protein
MLMRKKKGEAKTLSISGSLPPLGFMIGNETGLLRANPLSQQAFEEKGGYVLYRRVLQSASTYFCSVVVFIRT